MNWIFPIAGIGTRTKELGDYKPFIEVAPGVPMLMACLTGLKSLFRDGDTFTFISTKEHETKYKVTDRIFSLMSTVKPEQVFCQLVGRCDTRVYLLDETPPGQALTLLQGLSSCKEAWSSEVMDSPSIVINSDQFVTFDVEKIAPTHEPSVGIYFNDGDQSCFFDIDLHSSRVTRIKEKEKISSYASAGIFYFPNMHSIISAVQWGIESNVVTNGELYLASCLDYFPRINYFKTDIKFDLGTTDKIHRFKKFWSSLR